jgi:hypothetical protein
MIKGILIMLSAAVGLWFTTGALSDLWHYWRLDHKAAAQVTAWKVIELSPSEFALRANYRFVVNAKERKGKTIFQTTYLNYPSAEKSIEHYKKDHFQVWYNAKNPKISSLQKEFPAKKCLRALASLGVMIYFCSFLKIFSKEKDPFSFSI